MSLQYYLVIIHSNVNRRNTILIYKKNMYLIVLYRILCYWQIKLYFIFSVFGGGKHLFRIKCLFKR